MRFSACRAQCAAKIVQTPERKKEQRKQRAIFADYGRTASGAWYKKWLRPPHNAANTSVLFWQNKLFALEEGHLATEIDPDTLNTKQTTRFSIKKMERFSAHPSWVSDLQCGFNFGMTLGRKSKLQLFKLPKKGQAELLAEHELPGICNIHDFVATNTHLVFFIAPVRLNTKDALFGKKSFAHAQEWRPEFSNILIKQA